MRAVRLLACDPSQARLRVAAALVGAAGRRPMPPGPFVEAHVSRKRAPDRFRMAPEFEAVFEIGRLLPEYGVIVDPDGWPALVLVPDRPHPCTSRTILLVPEKLRGREWAAIVQHADQKRLGRFPDFSPAFFKLVLLYEVELFR